MVDDDVDINSISEPIANYFAIMHSFVNTVLKIVTLGVFPPEVHHTVLDGMLYLHTSNEVLSIYFSKLFSGSGKIIS